MPNFDAYTPDVVLWIHGHNVVHEPGEAFLLRDEEVRQFSTFRQLGGVV
jgi:hypothetical protein